MTIQVAHDFTCPWCWIAFHQVQRLEEEFGVEFEWLGYELWPDGLNPEDSKPAPVNPDRPRVPTRLELAYVASDAPKPRYASHDDRIHNALEAVEYARKFGVANSLVSRLYQAMWMEGKKINDVAVLMELAAEIVPSVLDMRLDIKTKAGQAEIVPFDETAYSVGVWNVPTFFIDGRRYAEQPLIVLQRAIRAVLN